MEPNIFSPRLNHLVKDSLSDTLRSLAYGVLVAVFGLLPIFFVPGVYASLGFTKTYAVTVAMFVAVLLLALSVLRSGKMRLIIPLPLAFFWGFALTAVASALLSGDIKDALYGMVFEVHTAGFMLLMALVMTVSLVFSQSKVATRRIFMVLGGSALILQLYHLLRLVIGADFLTFGIFTSSTASTIGGFNDLALFSGLVILCVLILLPQITTRLAGKVIASLLIVGSLIILSVVNFYAVWLMVGFFSLLAILYFLSRDTWLKVAEEGSRPVSRLTLLLVGLVCLTSGAFVISGDYIAGKVGQITGVSYLEVRPSFDSTLSITKSALRDNALLGTGPNRFEDAWRQYKNPVINQTIFWNTSFSGGSGYIPTILATTGIAGAVFMICFLLAFLHFGYRTLIARTVKDAGWYTIGVVSFMAALYLWIMALVYVPGAVILLLAALFTGLVGATYIATSAEFGVEINVTESRQYGLLLIATVLVVIISAVLVVIGVSKQFVANVIYADTVRAFQQESDFAAADSGLAKASELYAQDLFMAERAQLRLSQLSNQVATNGEVDAVTRQRNSNLLAEGISLTEQAINLDPTNPTNHIVLSNFYALLDPAQFEGMKERVEALFARMEELDPTNPLYSVLKAQYKVQISDAAGARESLGKAIEKKNDYTDAIFLLSQLDVQEGKVKDAIILTSALISIEPNNPTRYFQLGVLLATDAQLAEAAQAFETAIRLDGSYANARYFLALTYLDQDRTEEALVQLKLVRETNPDNEVLAALIAAVEGGTYEKSQSNFAPVVDSSTVSEEGGVTTTTEDPETDLVTPVNITGTPAAAETEETVVEEAEPQAE